MGQERSLFRLSVAIEKYGRIVGLVIRESSNKLLWTPLVAKGLRAAPMNTAHPVLTKSATVYALHGMRDFGEWQETLKFELNKRGIDCEFPRYDQFRLGRFLLQRWYADEIAIMVAQDLRRLMMSNERLVVVCHSFGTYLIHKVLLENADIKVDDIIFCASIFKPERQLQTLLRLGQIKGNVYNFCGTRDPWPVVAGIISTRYRPSGVIGIGAQRTENIYDAVGHGGFLNPKAWEKFQWYELIVGRGPSSNANTPRSWLVSTLLWVYNHKVISTLVTSASVAIVLAVAFKTFEWTCYLRTCSYEAFQLIEFGETADGRNFIERKTVIHKFDHGRSTYQFVAKPLPGGPPPSVQDLLARGSMRPSQGQPSPDPSRPAEIEIPLEVHSGIAIVLAEFRWPKSAGYPGGIQVSPNLLLKKFASQISLPVGVTMEPVEKDMRPLDGIVWYQTIEQADDSGKPKKMLVPSPPLGKCRLIENDPERPSCEDMALSPSSGMLYCFGVKGWGGEQIVISANAEDCAKYRQR